MITESNSPTFWTRLHNIYLSEHNPGHVTYGTGIYKTHVMADGSVAFEEIQHIDYIDSRSLTGSRKASYKNLDR